MPRSTAVPIGRSPRGVSSFRKADGRERPLGIAALEDKIVQRAVVEVLNAIYEEDFLGFSYGFRPGRGQHDALDALAVGISPKVNWICRHRRPIVFRLGESRVAHRFVEHRIGDPRMIRLIRKWLKAGVMEDGEWSRRLREPSGLRDFPDARQHLPPLCLDLWAEQWRRHQAHGNVITCATPTISSLVLSTKTRHVRFLADLRERMEKFALDAPS